MFFPSTHTLRRWREADKNNAITNCTHNDNSIASANERSETVDFSPQHVRAPETETFFINDIGNHISFNITFCYLGSQVDFMLDDTADTRCRIGKANKVVGALSFVWNADCLSLESKIKLYLAMSVNLALWNCELWSGNVGDLKLLDTFHHRSLRRIMHISMNQVKLERLTNKKSEVKIRECIKTFRDLES